MKATEPNPLDDRFAALLVEFDESLAAGSTDHDLANQTAGLEESIAQRLRRAQACLRLIENVRTQSPSVSAAAGDPARAEFAAESLNSLGRFRIVRELGRGGSGVVFLAIDPELDREVALKVPRPEALVTADLRQRFLREAKAAASLSHAHIVPVFEAGNIGPICYIASDYCDGPSLAEWLRQRGSPLDAAAAAQLLATLAEAVQHAHDRGVLHRDLKPANVLLQDTDPQVGGYGNPKIADFGLAKTLHAASDETRQGAIIGTPSYMAPEQAEGRNRDVGPAADIYALGAVLYELLTGRPPFRKDTDLATLQAVQVEEPIPPRRLQPTIPRDLEAICLKCLEKRPDQRYASATALASDLHRFLLGEPVQARHIGTVDRLGRWCRRNPLLAGVTATAVATFIIGFGLVAWQWRRAEAGFDRAQEEATRAQEEKDFTRAALDAMTSQVANDWLAAQRELAPEQKRFLQSAAEYYRRFAAESAVDEAGRVRVASAAFRLGNLLDKLGERADAEAAFRQVLGLRQQLVADAPENATYRLDLAKAYQSLDLVLRSVGRWPEAEESCRESLKHCQHLTEQYPPEAVYRSQLAEAQNNLGTLLRTRRRFDESEAAHRTAIDLRRKLVTEAPGNPEYRRKLSFSCNNLANLLFEQQRQSEGEPFLRESLQLKEQLVHEQPSNTTYAHELALGFTNQGLGLKRLGRRQEAEEMCRRGALLHLRVVDALPSVPDYRHLLGWALQSHAATLCDLERWSDAETNLRQSASVLEELLRQYPGRSAYQVQLGLTYNNLGNVMRDRGDHEAAPEWYAKSIAVFEEVLGRDPKQGAARFGLQQAHWGRATVRAWLKQYDEALQDWDRAIELDSGPMRDSLRLARGTTLVRAGRHAEALVEADRLTSQTKVDVATLYNGAAVYSLASAAPQVDAEQSERSASRALELLKRAIAAGFSDAAHLKKDRSFEPLRSRPDFQRVLTDAERITNVDGAQPRK